MHPEKDTKDAPKNVVTEVSRNLRQIQHGLHSHNRSLRQSSNLTTHQLALLETLRVRSHSVTELARAISRSRATVSEMLNRLSGRHLVDRKPHPNDARRVVVSLTERGAQALHNAPGSVPERLVAWLDALRTDERRAVTQATEGIAMAVSPG